MTINLDDVVVRDNAAARRYEAQVDGALALLQYHRSGDTITLSHAETPRELAGQGIASKLTQFALDDARSQGLMVIPSCPFVAAYIRRHRAYLDLVPPKARGRYLGVST